MDLVVGAWVNTGQDCDPDNHFDPPTGMPEASFSLSRDHTYELSLAGEEPRGTFRIEPYEYYGDNYLVVLEQAELTYILNIDRLESWNLDGVKTQCTQLFERPQ